MYGSKARALISHRPFSSAPTAWAACGGSATTDPAVHPADGRCFVIGAWHSGPVGVSAHCVIGRRPAAASRALSVQHARSSPPLPGHSSMLRKPCFPGQRHHDTATWRRARALLPTGCCPIHRGRIPTPGLQQVPALRRLPTAHRLSLFCPSAKSARRSGEPFPALPPPFPPSSRALQWHRRVLRRSWVNRHGYPKKRPLTLAEPELFRPYSLPERRTIPEPRERDALRRCVI